jgi:hypothetical protein
MLAVVKKPHIELSISGEGADELIAWIRRKFPVKVLVADEGEQTVPVEETEFYQELQENRAGNLLEAA